MKRVFRSKIVYWFSIIYFSLNTLILFTSSFGLRIDSFDIFRFIILLSLSIFSLIICVSLFEKLKNTITLINVYILIYIFFILFLLLKNHLEYHIYYKNQIYYLVFLVLYMIILNFFKYDSKKYDEINNIGNTE